MPQNRQVENFSSALLSLQQAAPPTLPNLYSSKMPSLLQIASRVEAAVKAYAFVCDFANKEMWASQFKMELVSPYLHSNRMLYI